MTALPTILRLARRRLQIARQRRKVKRIEQRAMMQQMSSLALLRVAGNLALAPGNVARTLHGQRRNERRERIHDSPQNVAVRSVQIGKRRITIKADDETVEQAARAKENGAAAAGTPQD